MTQDQALIEMERVVDWLKYGCGNHGCQFHPPEGMGTNSICRCSPLLIANRLLDIAAELYATGRKFDPIAN